MKRILLYLSAGIIFLFGSCKEESTAPDSKSELVPTNIFPLIIGNSFEYSGYLTKNDSEEKIPGTETGFSASWTIMGEKQLSEIFPMEAIIHITPTSSILIIDSVTVDGVITEPKVTPVCAYYNTSTKDYYYLTNFGYFFRKYKIGTISDTTIRKDSLRFIKLASPSVGTSIEYIADSSTFVSYVFGPTSPSSLQLRIIGTFKRKEMLELTVNGVDSIFTTYYLEIKSVTILGESITAKFWLAENIGPVQMFLAGDDEAPGSFRKLKAKNF